MVNIILGSFIKLEDQLECPQLWYTISQCARAGTKVAFEGLAAPPNEYPPFPYCPLPAEREQFWRWLHTFVSFSDCTQLQIAHFPPETHIPPIPRTKWLSALWWVKKSDVEYHVWYYFQLICHNGNGRSVPTLPSAMCSSCVLHITANIVGHPGIQCIQNCEHHTS